MKYFFTTTSDIQSGTQHWCDKDVLVVMPCTNIAQAQQVANLAVKRAGMGDSACLLCVFDQDRAGFIHVVNEVFLHSKNKWIGYIAQDAFTSRLWLKLAMETLEDQQKKFIGFNDGKWQGQIASYGLASREWINSIYASNFYFFPEYHSHYADVELTLIARQQSVYAYNPNSVVMEVDWEKDEKSVHKPDRLLFSSRKGIKFNGLVHDENLLQLAS